MLRPFLLVPQIHDMNVCSRSGVVGQIPARMVRVVIDNDGVAIPEPVADVGVIEWSNTEEETVKPETLPAAASQVELVLTPKASGKAPMLPGPLEMKTMIVASKVVSDPSAIAMDVGSFRVPGRVGESPVFHFAMTFRNATLWHMRCGRGRPMRRNETATDATMLAPAPSFLRYL